MSRGTPTRAARADRADDLGPVLGDDVVPVPEPVTERPPPDRFCDLVLTGGVASGVVYPWAVVELARHYHFKNIGGTSVGAMAAALAAAGEYGRRRNLPGHFEALRRVPGELAKDVGGGRTRLLALFQPAPRGRRLFDLFIAGVRRFYDGVPSEEDEPLAPGAPGDDCRRPKPAPPATAIRRPFGFALTALRAFRVEALVGALWALWLLAAVVAVPGCLAYLAAPALGRAAAEPWSPWWAIFAGGALPVALIGAAIGVLRGALDDLQHGVIDNDLGLVRGGAVAGHDAADDPALTAWLHDGIQRSAGMVPGNPLHPPLTFGDLWGAPAYPGAPPREPRADAGRGERSINLVMITTNVTHGRPYRLPIADESSRLYFRFEEFEQFFPDDVMAALRRVAVPYRQRPHSGDPDPRRVEPGFFELPGADLPIVVAARLSLSFPLLFSALPVYAVDYEMCEAIRTLKRCRFSDGGICSNFPIHLFDSPAPRWPTFGMWLGQRSPYRQSGPDRDGTEAVWLPNRDGAGRGDIWTRFEPADGEDRAAPLGWRNLLGFLLAAGISAKDWGDRSGMRMAHVRRRVARLNLLPGEGELNLAMPRDRILRMAHKYGTQAGRLFVRNYVPEAGEDAAPAWGEHQRMRLKTLILTLHDFLDGLNRASRFAAHSEPLDELIERSTRRPPGSRAPGLAGALPQRRGPAPRALPGRAIPPEEADALHAMLQAICRLEDLLRPASQRLSDKPLPTPELRIRPPI